MGARALAWMNQIDALSLRERAILLMVCLLVLVMLGDRLLIGPSLQAIAQQRLLITELQSKLVALQLRSTELGAGEAEPFADEKARVAQLEAQLAEQSTRFEQQLGTLVQPRQAAQLLRDVLDKEPGLRLVSLETEPGAALLGREEVSSRIVRHNLEVRVEGGYLAVLDYLKRLEALPWTFIWSELELQVGRHPTSNVQLSLYTLGQRP